MQGGDYNNNVFEEQTMPHQVKTQGNDPISSGDMPPPPPSAACAVHGNTNHVQMYMTPTYATSQKKYVTNTPQRNRYYSPHQAAQPHPPNGYVYSHATHVQTLPQLQQLLPPPKDMNVAIKDMFARKGICLEHSTKVGSGRYSKVITAQTLSGATIAIKMINKRMVTPEFRNKFLPREISCWKRLKHQNIVQICGHYEALGFVFLLMEYGNGGDMLSYVQRTGPVGEEQSATWMREICSAVRYMHDNDMAHRDLKLENIVLFGAHVKISDFGFSRKVNAELSYTFCGSKSYSAPEILLGAAYNPFKADVWSLGVITYVICTDLMPYRENCSNNKIVEAQKNSSYSFPSKLNLSTACKAAIDEMMTFDAKARPNIHQVMNMSWFSTTRAAQIQHRENSINAPSDNSMVHRHQMTHQHHAHQPYPSPHHLIFPSVSHPSTPRTPSMPLRTHGGAAHMMYNYMQQQRLLTPQNSTQLQKLNNSQQSLCKKNGASPSQQSLCFPISGETQTYDGFAPQGYGNQPMDNRRNA